MKYLVLCYYDVKDFAAMTPKDLEAMIAVCKPHDEELKKTGKVDFIASQSDPKDWRCVRAPRNEPPRVTQGPWADVREQVGAFFIVEAKDMDEATAIAMKHPGPHISKFLGGGLEIRACDYHEAR